MKLSRLEPKKTYLVTILVWMIACVAINGWRIYAYINNPNDLDQYAHTWRFGLFVFALFYFPFWLLGLLTLLAGEMTYFAKRRPGASS